ncbi:DUF2345 domain-containing protein, partial [Acinetobacter rongchengensis]
TQNNYIVHALNKMSMFAIQDVKWVAAQGKFSIHVQSNGMQILAQQKIQISSVDGQIVITAPNGISIKSRNSEIKLDDAGIGLITSHVLEHQSGQHVFKTGSIISLDSPAMPVYGLSPKELELKYLYDDLKPVKQTPYKLLFTDGTSQEGVLDANGYAKVSVPGDKIQSKVYYGFSEIDATPDKEKLNNSFKDKKVMSITEAEQLIEQYNQQEIDALLDEYFPDEIEEMIEANDIEYEDHIADYEEQFVKQHNHSDEALNDDAEEILLNSDPISRLNLGDE